MPFGSRYGSATQPLKLKNEAIRTILCRALLHQNIRGQLKDGQRRHEFKAVHGFRKFFKTQCEKVMRPANIELLMGHNIGLSKSYYKPTERELLEDYLKAVDLLTLNEEQKLKNKVKELSKKKDEMDYIIKGKLEEKDEEIKSLKQKLETDMDIFQEKVEKEFKNCFKK